MKRSRYLLIGSKTYRDSAGAEVRFAYATRTGTVFALPLPVAAALENGEDVSDHDLAPTLSDIAAVVPEDENELRTVTSGFEQRAAESRNRTFTVMPTSYCNMDCDYCGQEHFKTAVNWNRVDRMTGRITGVLEQPQVDGASVTWFGGEPMLAYKVITTMSARIVAAAERLGKTYSAALVTNGSLLTPGKISELSEECRVRLLEVTIDGPREIHNARRHKRNGKGSFDTTVEALAETVSSGMAPDLAISVRVNVDRENREEVDNLLFDLAHAGLAVRRIELHLAPVHSWGNDVSAVELQAKEFAAWEIAAYETAHRLGFSVPRMPNRPKAATCLATTRKGELIDPLERVYSCSEHPLVPGPRSSEIIGTVESLGNTLRPAGKFDDWYAQVTAGEWQCSSCPILPVCGGSCPKLWTEGHLPCPSIKFNWDEKLSWEAERRGYVPAAPANPNTRV
ncbi:radical SAM protein [Glycomyces sp. L485]|uniref:radical SAM/SPASM domain-containing protein n=1 Tax=Glycomyces sp. L485 TaxID=2909235 RepID=UPI001F4A8F7F|nr:radical SAM protein [Glycomyces sp. L485]MCH7232154.1 radical SAM protein [Glycomyces sp. L485]